jgi:hypothetical protein
MHHLPTDCGDRTSQDHAMTERRNVTASEADSSPATAIRLRIDRASQLISLAGMGVVLLLGAVV